MPTKRIVYRHNSNHQSYLGTRKTACLKSIWSEIGTIVTENRRQLKVQGKLEKRNFFASYALKIEHIHISTDLWNHRQNCISVEYSWKFIYTI